MTEHDTYNDYLAGIETHTPEAVVNAEVLVPRPVFHEKIWGGHHLQSDFHYDLPDEKIGECWAIAAHEAGDAAIACGPFTGEKLSKLFATRKDLFGNIKATQFPLLVKILDAQDDLSIQVHPDDEYAGIHEGGSLGKSECWYVLSAKPDATIVVGQKARNKEEFSRAVARGAWDELLNEIPIKAGDFFQIDPGCVHAVKAGTVVLEPQQSSDITYRVYDYDRKQKDGTLRELHMEKSLDVIDFDARPITSGEITSPEVDGKTTLVQSKYYTVVRLRVDGSLTLSKSWPFACVSVVEGEGMIQGVPVVKGTHLILTSRAQDLCCEGKMVAIVTYIPDEK